MEEREVNWKDYSWSWDDAGILGSFEVKCQCGGELKVDTFDVDDGELVCPKCDWTYHVKRETKVLGFPPKDKEVVLIKGKEEEVKNEEER